MKSMLEQNDRQELLDRLARLTPDAARRFGTMSAPQMVAHLTDQMTHTLNDVKFEARGRFLRLAPVRWLTIYVFPWPKGSVKGPPEAFVTRPVAWDDDVARLVALVERFGVAPAESLSPTHALFGKMSQKDWGHFCYKHFDHHFGQFGV